MKLKKLLILLALLLPLIFLLGCTVTATETIVTLQSTPILRLTATPTQSASKSTEPPTSIPPTPTTQDTATEITPQATVADSASQTTADVLAVSVNGKPGSYQFSVEISSPDTGCDQYADWWEVVDESGNLLYRRILAHSHVDEQPFTRSGGAVEIDEETIVIVRAHMNPGGYGGTALKGSAAGGFQPIDLEAEFAAGLESESPLPSGCAF